MDPCALNVMKLNFPPRRTCDFSRIQNYIERPGTDGTVCESAPLRYQNGKEKKIGKKRNGMWSDRQETRAGGRRKGAGREEETVKRKQQQQWGCRRMRSGKE